MTETDDIEEAPHSGLVAWLWPGEWREAVARWVIAALVAAVAATALVLHPWLNFLLWPGGLLAGFALRRNREKQDAAKEAEDEALEMTADDVAALTRALIGDAKGVLLTAVRDHLEELAPAGWTTKDVRELLDDCEIPVRPGVRTPAGNGPGVHRDDVPPLPATPPTPDGVVAAGQDANTNTNNVTVVRHAEGALITVTPVRQGVNGS